MPNYQNGKIYKIVNYENDDIYIGSTCEPTLARRLAEHVSCYKRYLDGKFAYLTSFKVIETGNYDIQLIEMYPCNNKMELHAREGYWIRLVDCVNKNVAGRSKKKYYEVNKEAISKQRKVYREENREMISKQRKAYYESNKDKKKAYYENNKERISEKRDKQQECICGKTYTLRHKARHMKSKKHNKYINSIEFLKLIYEVVKSIADKCRI